MWSKVQNFLIVSKIFAFFWFLTFFHVFSVKMAATRWKIVRNFFFRDFCHFFHQIFRFCPHIWHLYFSPSVDLSYFNRGSLTSIGAGRPQWTSTNHTKRMDLSGTQWPQSGLPQTLRIWIAWRRASLVIFPKHPNNMKCFPIIQCAR